MTREATVIVCLIAILLAVAAYCIGYFSLGDLHIGFNSNNRLKTRLYDSPLVAAAFTPAAQAESLFTGCKVSSRYYGQPATLNPP